MFRVLAMFFIFCSVTQSLAASVLPSNLSAGDRAAALEVLGFGSAAKLLSSPYPLGGYSGVEVGITSEYIPLTGISGLGSRAPERSDFNYFSLVVGKGLYYNVDLLIQFIPIPQDESVSGFGGQIRWSFYEAEFMPLALSFVFHGSDMNFGNSLGTETTGIDLIGSVNMKDVSLFFGLGPAHSIGTFSGGTDSGLNETANIKATHSMFGVSFKIEEMFVALEVDRFIQSTYAGKLGVRF